MVPLRRDWLNVDLFAELQLPIVLCARTSLGTINHSLLSIEALRILADEPERRDRLYALIAHAKAAFAPLGIAPSGSQIVPVILGDDKRTMQAASALQDAGFDVRGIRPPTVPAGTSRLRISLTLNAAREDVTALARCLEGVLA
jgi:8-amino-7-oxononanoate synthase